MSLRNGKAAGPDEIPTEAIKGVWGLQQYLKQEEQVPREWNDDILIKLPKKGDLGEYSNYREIMFLSVPDKALNRVILERMKEAVTYQDIKSGTTKIVQFYLFCIYAIL